MRRVIAASVLLLAAHSAPADLAGLRGVDQTPPEQVMAERVGTWTFTDGKTKDQRTGRFVEYTPPDWDGVTPLPLLVFLHGAGARTERGDTIGTLYDEFLLKLIRAGRTFDAIVLCPQVSSYWGEQGVEFLDQALIHYQGKFDPDRVYLTGLSSGGGGTWTAALERHNLLAAAVPICGIRKPTDRDGELVALPIWAFHNAHDPYQSVEYTRAHVQAIRAAGGKYIRYTEFADTPGKSHPGKDGQPVFPACHKHAWEAAYTDDALWAWLFHQRRGQPERSAEGG